MKLEHRNPSRLKDANYNPKIRTETAAIRKLLGSVEDHGILMPLLIDKHGNIIEGHRRKQCALILGLKTVPCIIAKDGANKEELYREINSTGRGMASRELMWVYVNGGKVPGRMEGQIKQLESILGTPIIRKMAAAYISPNILHEAQRVVKYCNKQREEEFLAKTILWLFHHKMSWLVRAAITTRSNNQDIIKAINSNKPLQRKYV